MQHLHFNFSLNSAVKQFKAVICSKLTKQREDYSILFIKEIIVLPFNQTIFSDDGVGLSTAKSIFGTKGINEALGKTKASEKGKSQSVNNIKGQMLVQGLNI